MQRSRRTAVYGVVTGLLTAGTLTAAMPAAHANVAGFCDGSGAAATCTVTETITAPTSVTVAVRATVNGVATVSWRASCTLNGQTTTDSGGLSSESPATASVTLPVTGPASCTVSATISLPTSDSTNTLSVAMTYTTAASPSPSPSPSPTPSPVAGSPVKGYAGKCLDDTNNSSANDAKIQIWTCNGGKAQLWTYHSGELVHNGKCLNDQAWGGLRAKQILWTCNHALNELWTHLSNGEYVLNANGYKLCLDDPASSTKNGTQLIVFTCKDSSNQRWSLPTVVP